LSTLSSYTISFDDSFVKLRASTRTEPSAAPEPSALLDEALEDAARKFEKGGHRVAMTSAGCVTLQEVNLRL
jgi:hypothetical protein